MLAISLLLVVSFSINSATISIEEKTKKQDDFVVIPQQSYVQETPYEDWWAIYSTGAVSNYLIYNFSSSKTYIGITVRAMNDGNYSKFTSNQTYSYYTLSGGSFYSYSETWSIPYCDTWYVVFLNLDPDQETTTLTFDASFFGLCGAAGCGYDSYESNDGFSSAYALSDTSNTITGSICSGDKDYFKIYLSSGSNYRITLTWVGSSDLDLTLYNSAYSTVASSSGVSNTETIDYYVSTSGYYYILVDHYIGSTTVSYTLSTSTQTGDGGIDYDDPFDNIITIFLAVFIGIFVFIVCIVVVIVKAASSSGKKKTPNVPPSNIPPPYVPANSQNVRIGQPATLVPNQTPPQPYGPYGSQSPKPYTPGPAPAPASAPAPAPKNQNNEVQTIPAINICPYCGIEIDNDVKYAITKKQDAYCRYCGSKLN